MDKYLRPSEVARMLKLNTETIYHYIKTGDLPAARLGRKYIVTEKDLDSFIQRRKEASSIRKLDLSEKGQKMVEQTRANAQRVLDFIGEFPGATKQDIEDALEMEAKDVDRALRKLEETEQAHRERDADQAEASEDMWYLGPEEK